MSLPRGQWDRGELYLSWVNVVVMRCLPSPIAGMSAPVLSFIKGVGVAIVMAVVELGNSEMLESQMKLRVEFADRFRTVGRLCSPRLTTMLQHVCRL